MHCSLPTLMLTLAVALLSACNNSTADRVPDADEQLIRQWHLPAELREISGLALTDNGRLLAVADEEAIVYEIDFAEGGLVKRFTFGRPAVRGDFEGIAVTGTTVWLMTSKGDLYAAGEGDDGESVPYREYETDIGKYCELEGLTKTADAASLLLACKDTKDKDDPLRIFSVRLDEDAIERGTDFVVAEKALAQKIGRKRLRPTAITIDPETGNRIMLDANHLALLTTSPDGGAIDAIILPGQGRHRQPEGIAITDDGRLLIADEGGNGRARLAVYRWTSGSLGPEE